MLTAVALVLGTVVLVKMQRTKYIWVTVIPAAWLLLCTTPGVSLKPFSTNPQMEGFFMAQQYKEKIASGGELTAQQIAKHEPYRGQQLHQRRPEHPVPGGGVQHHLYGIKTGSLSATIKCVPTKRPSYVPVPEGGVKTSSHH